MDTQQLQLFQTFEDIRQEKDGIEFWSARDLQKVLGYTKWENFQNAIKRAKDSMETWSWSVEDHFPNIRKPIVGWKWATQYVDDITLSRYACYLIAINGDITKPEISFAQAYFLSKARSLEILEQKMSEMERLSEREKQSYVKKWFYGFNISEETPKKTYLEYVFRTLRFILICNIRKRLFSSIHIQYC
jgi:DNA-damage-inducible protein D